MMLIFSIARIFIIVKERAGERER